jgi:hypothetical protein
MERKIISNKTWKNNFDNLIPEPEFPCHSGPLLHIVSKRDLLTRNTEYHSYRSVALESRLLE